jgi:hypothetical protein
MQQVGAGTRHGNIATVVARVMTRRILAGVVALIVFSAGFVGTGATAHPAPLRQAPFHHAPLHHRHHHHHHQQHHRHHHHRHHHHRRDTTVPAVHIDNPLENALLSGSILFNGTATDDSGVRRVQLLVDSYLHPRRADGTTTWSYMLDTTDLPDGQHVITIRATDARGNRALVPITVNLANGNTPDPSPSPSPDPDPSPSPSPDPGPAPSPAPSPSPSPSPSPAPSPSPSPSPTPVPSQGTPPVVLGIWSDGGSGHTTVALQAQIGRTFGGFRFNHGIMNDVPGKADDLSFDAGLRLVYHNADSENLDGSPMLWADVASGVYDWRLAQVVQAIKSDPRWTHATPFLLSFQHEQDGVVGAGTPEDYKAAFRHVFATFQSAGILWRSGGSVELVWDVTKNALNAGGTARPYDPDLGPDGSTVVGDYYDILGLDVYDKLQSDGHLGYTDPHQAFDPAHSYALARGKQFGVFEFGVSEGAPGEKALVFSQVVSTLKSYGVGIPGSAMALMYSNVTGKQVYYPDTSPDALAAFIAMAHDPFLGG